MEGCNNDLLKHAPQFTENVTELKNECAGPKNSPDQCLAMMLVLSVVVSQFK